MKRKGLTKKQREYYERVSNVFDLTKKKKKQGKK